MEILRFPHPSLFLKCKEVDGVDHQSLKLLLDEMWETMMASNGLGLAANQVNISLRVVVMAGPDKEKIYLVNPKIEKLSIGFANLKEGCLSSPGEFVVVPERADWVQVSFQDEKGNRHLRVFEGIYAICLQHEIDHLEGKAFIQNKSIPKNVRIKLQKKWGIK